MSRVIVLPPSRPQLGESDRHVVVDKIVFWEWVASCNATEVRLSNGYAILTTFTPEQVAQAVRGAE